MTIGHDVTIWGAPQNILEVNLQLEVIRLVLNLVLVQSSQVVDTAPSQTFRGAKALAAQAKEKHQREASQCGPQGLGQWLEVHGLDPFEAAKPLSLACYKEVRAAQTDLSEASA